MLTMIQKILKKKAIRIIASVLLFCLFAFILYATLDSQKTHNIYGIVFSFIFQFLLSILLLSTFISDSVDKDNSNQKPLAFLTNLIFMASATLFFINTFYDKLWFQIVTFVSLFILLIFVYISIKRKNEYDLSYLKITNYFMIIFFSGLLFLLKKHFNNENLQDIIYFYYFFPLLMLQGLYELLNNNK